MTEIKNGSLITKAYKVYHEGMLYNDYSHDEYVIDNQPVVHAKTVGEAKTHGLYDLDSGSLGRELLFTDMRTKRAKYSDIVYFEGEEVERWKMEDELEARKRIEKIEALPNDEMYYVQDRRNYVGNAVLWWGLNSSGYVTDLKKAQKYTKKEIVDKFARGRDTDVIWISSHVETAVREYVDAQGLERKYCL